MVEPRSLEGPYGKIHYLYGGMGPPLILIHGGGPSTASLAWGRNVAALGRKHTVFAPDLPGFGRSEPLPRFRLHDLGRFVTDFMDRVELERAFLTGVSLGGAVALWCALHHPQRVVKLALVGSLGLTDQLPFRTLASVAVRVPWFHGWVRKVAAGSPWLRRWGLAYNLHDLSTVTPELDAGVAHELGTGGKGWNAFLREETGSGRFACDFREDLPRIHCPVLLVHGEMDRLVPVEAARRAADLLPRAQLEVLPDCGHWVPWEQADKFNRLLLEFLA